MFFHFPADQSGLCVVDFFLDAKKTWLTERETPHQSENNTSYEVGVSVDSRQELFCTAVLSQCPHAAA